LVVGALDTDLSARPCIKVLDFGIAKIQSPDALHKTTTGMMLGTPAYMSPEQVSGETVSHATDIYAFGEILFEMLAGRRLFEGKGREIMKAKVSDHPPPLDLPKDLPHRQHFTTLIRACLSPEQSARPTIVQLAESLRSLQSGHAKITPLMITPTPMQAAPYQATLSGVANTTVMGPPRSKWMILALAGVFAFMLAGILLFAVLRDPEPIGVKAIPLEEPKQELVAPPPPPPPPIEAPSAEPPPPEVVKKAVKKAEPIKKPKPREEAKPLKKGEFPTW
jgi:serine/threonine-protein kinase